MLRALTALLIASLPAAASAQGFRGPPPAFAWAPPAFGGFGYGARPNFGVGVRPQVGLGYGGLGYGGYGLGYGGFGYGGLGYGGYGYGPVYGGYVPTFSPFDLPVSAAPAPAVVASSPASDGAAVAEVVVEFPAEVELTVNGRPEPGRGPERSVRTGPLKIGETATLKLRATWTLAGEKFEWDRELTLTRGEFSRLAVARGFAVRP